MARWYRTASGSSYEALEGSWCGMKSPVITAALTLSLTGQYERQGIEAAEGVRLWAHEADIR
jgi:hypothetical protein